MTAADHPSGPRPVPPRPQPPTTCPPPLALACFVDGTLPPTDRAAMIEHLAECDDCRDTVVMAAEAPPLGASRPAPATTAVPVATGDPGAPRPGPSARRYGPWAAAAVGLAATIAFAVQLQRPAVPATEGPWREIAAAIGATRPIEGRLTQVPGYAAPAAPTRAPSDARQDFAAAAVAARLAEALASAPPEGRPAAAHAAGVAALVAGQAGPALKLLDEAAAGAPDSADVRADLAAAHLAIAGQGSRLHWAAALEAADTALRLRPDLAPALFNRALALEGLGRPDEARDVWRALAAAEGDDPAWRAEAASRLERLSR